MDSLEKGQAKDGRPRRAWTISMAVVTLLGISAIAVMTTNLLATTDLSTPLGKVKQCLQPPILDQDATQPITECGSSREEAIAKGCVFDIMYNGWLPPLCHDADLHEEAMQDTTYLASINASGPFPWWRDDKHTTLVDQNDLWSLEQGHAFTWESYHVAHCLYDWRFLVKSINRQLAGEDVWIPERIMNATHIDHCNIVTALQAQRAGAKVMVIFGYGTCVRLPRQI